MFECEIRASQVLTCEISMWKATLKLVLQLSRKIRLIETELEYMHQIPVDEAGYQHVRVF